MIEVPIEKNELVPIRSITWWRVCMDYWKLNASIEKDHFPMPFMDKMLDRLAGKGWYCFLDGYSDCNQISIAPKDQEKTTFTCPYGTFSFKRMPFGLCNAPTTFQRCMMSIFSDMVEQNNRGIYGWFFCFWWLIWSLFESLVRSSQKMWTLQPCAKLGKMTLYGERGYCIGPRILEKGI